MALTIDEGIGLATLIIDGGAKAIALATQALQAYREQDDAKALGLLDQALDHFDSTTPVVRAELEEIKARAKQRIADKFPPASAVEPPK